MMRFIKKAWLALTDEIFLKSFGGDGEVDTFFRWLLSVCFIVAFYLVIYHFDEQAVRYDHWMHETFGQTLSDVPSAGKVAWHRLTAGALSGVGIFVCTLSYGISLWRRIKARIAASKVAKQKQAPQPETLPPA